MKPAPIAKIARPKLSGTVKRDRLFQLLDQGKQKPVIWVAAQGGSGKTTLVADWLDSRKLPCLWYQVDEGDADIASFFYYMGKAAKHAAPRYKKSLPALTPEYLQGIPVFTRRYFEALFSRLKLPSVVVLDNYQDAPLASGFHDMIAQGLETIPEEITVVILSRTAPPPQLARLQANNRLHSIIWDDVRFTREEALALLETQGRGKLSAEALNVLHDKTEGWAAGLILLAGAGTVAPEGMSADKLFDYFASEIFNKTEASVQDILLKTSFLQKITPTMAEQLTGNVKAGEMLERMSKGHYFTQKYGQAYQYHPLFREFLQSLIKIKFSSAVIIAVQRKAAELLDQSGSEEEAVELYIAAKDWSNAERVIFKQASALASQGRSNTLEAWLNSFPQEHIEASSWGLFWLGICSLAYNPILARSYLEKAFLQFKKQADASGLFLAWASIVDSIVYEFSDFNPLKHWLAVADDLFVDYPEFPSAEIEARVVAGMLIAITWLHRDHPESPLWAERAKQIALHNPGIEPRMILGNNLIYYYLWSGEFTKARLLLEALQPISELKEITPITLLTWHLVAAIYAWYMADSAACMESMASGLRISEESGVHLLDLYFLGVGIYCGVTLGDLSAAQNCLAKMAKIQSPRSVDQCFYHEQASSVAWGLGDFKKAVEHGELSVQAIEPTGCSSPYLLCMIELAVTSFDDGRHEEGRKLLARTDGLLQKNRFLFYASLLYGARFAFESGEEEQGLALLKQGLALGSLQGYVNMYRWNGQTMSSLCAKALEHNIEPDYVRKLIRTRGLVAEGVVANWPYPIRIYTLGKFEILKDDQPITFSGKVQKKPIELLKALIAFGGTEVPEGRLIDALWPDSEGDAGHGTLKSTVLRLRQLLGSDKAVLVSGGAVTLNRSLCYADAFAFEQVMKEAEMESHGESVSKIFDLYRGQFLPADAASAWTVMLRERLQNKFLRYNLKTGKALEGRGCFAEAIEHYHRALDADDQHEEFYQRLMSCHLQLGQQAEAAATYQRCKRTLHKTFGAPLSDITEALNQAALERKI